MNHRNRSAKNAYTLHKGYGFGHKKWSKLHASKLVRKGGKFLVDKELEVYLMEKSPNGVAQSC